jgi:hypothetical protein
MSRLRLPTCIGLFMWRVEALRSALVPYAAAGWHQLSPVQTRMRSNRCSIAIAGWEVRSDGHRGFA